MNCATFQELRSEYRSDRLAPELRRQAQVHLAACAECRFLEEPPVMAPEALDLTPSILARTTGSPCVRLQELACAFVDGELEEPRVALVQGHLRHCPQCSALVASLAELGEVLPTLALLEPGPRFTQEILRATSRYLVAPAEPGPPFWPGLGEFWVKLIRRPRICLEAAYLGTVAGVMVLNLPALHVRAGVVETLRGAQPGSLLQPLLHSAKDLAADVADFEKRGADSLRRTIRRGGAGIAQELTQEAQGLGALWHRFSAEVVAWFQHLTQSLPGAKEKPPEPGEPSAPAARSSH